MGDSPAPTPPKPLDRAALERVLARASELQARSSDPTDLMTDEQVVSLGKEVGLTPAYLRQALAEERARRGAPDPSGFRFASTTVWAERTVRGTAAEVFAALDTWMEKEEWLQIKRQFADRMVWEARRDFEGGVRRMLNVGGRGYALSKATDVGATVVPADEGRVLVRLDADLSGARRGAMGGMAGAIVGGAAAGGILIALNFAALAAAGGMVLLSGAGYWGARASFNATASRVQLALEQTLDRLERGERADNPSLLKLIAQAAAAAKTRF
jgi:hypothetical protein